MLFQSCSPHMNTSSWEKHDHDESWIIWFLQSLISNLAEWRLSFFYHAPVPKLQPAHEHSSWNNYLLYITLVKHSDDCHSPNNKPLQSIRKPSFWDRKGMCFMTPHGKWVTFFNAVGLQCWQIRAVFLINVALFPKVEDLCDVQSEEYELSSPATCMHSRTYAAHFNYDQSFASGSQQSVLKLMLKALLINISNDVWSRLLDTVSIQPSSLV